MSEAFVPVVDVSPLVRPGPERLRRRVAGELGAACREWGFFTVVGHGVDPALEARLDVLSRIFFARPEAEKRAIRMALGGRAWRGWFPVGGELTSGRPDAKEGIYFGAELGEEDARVRAGWPLHGRNLFPDLPGFRETVLAWIDAMTTLGHALLEGLARALALDPGYFRAHYTGDPLVLFRIFHYPATAPSPDGAPVFGVGEHTDYGVLTILKQDDAGGLEVHARGRWLEVTPMPGALVCNLGDMLERMTGGRFRSTPHRVLNRSGRSRLSFPFFFDPGWEVAVGRLPGCEEPPPGSPARERWDGADPLAFEGTYGDYLLAKVSKVFPALGGAVL